MEECVLGTIQFSQLAEYQAARLNIIGQRNREMRKKYRVNSGKSSKLWTILSQATKALVEGAETSWGVTNLTRNTTLAPDNFGINRKFLYFYQK